MSRRVALALVAAFLAGLILGHSAAATPRPVATAIPADAWRQVEVSHDPAPVPAAASGDARPEDSLVPAAPSMEPTAPEVAASVPGSSPAAVESDEPRATGALALPSPGTIVTAAMTWYCNADRSRAQLSPCRRGYPDRAGILDLFAATSRSLARAGWRIGRDVTVCIGPRCVTARIVDECGTCPGMAVDLYADAMVQLAPLSVGRLPGLVVR